MLAVGDEGGVGATGVTVFAGALLAEFFAPLFFADKVVAEDAVFAVDVAGDEDVLAPDAGR